MTAITREERFWSKVDKTGDCWLWTGTRDPKGYGSFSEGRGSTRGAHRVAWEMANGPVPEGLYLDHLCRTPACVRVSHLEPVTNGENVLRGIGPSARAARQTECVNGHPFTGDNLRTAVERGRERRVCRACTADRAAAYRARKGAVA